MLGGGRFKKKKNNPKTTNLQLWRQNGNGMWTGRRMIVFNKKKRERLNFFVQTQGTVRQGKRDTRSWKGILVSYFSSWQKQMELAQYHAADPFLIFFFLFFSFFVLWAGSLASKDNFPWTPCANCAVFLLESVYKTK